MRRLVAVIFGAALVLTACSSASSVSSESSVEPTPPSDAELLQDWANDVCSSADLLNGTVAGVAAGFDFDLGSGLDQLPQIEEQVAATIDVVEVQIDELQATLAEVPPTSTEGQELATELDGLIESARTSGQEAVTLIGQATSADNFIEAGISAAGAAAAAESAFSDANAAIDVLDELRSTATGDLGEAFSAASACQS